MHRIEIKNFGPIKHFEAELKDLMFFIGPQASGKSTISKIIFFCRSLHGNIFRFASETTLEELSQSPQLISVFYRHLEKQAKTYFGETEGEFVYHVNSQDSVRVKLSAHNSTITLTESLETQLNLLLEEVKLFKQETQATIKYREILVAQQTFSTNIEKKLFELFEDRRLHIFVPAGRNSVAMLARQQRIDWNVLDQTIQNFLQLINKIKEFSDIPLTKMFENKKISEGLFYSSDNTLFSLAIGKIKCILKGEYFYHRASRRELLVFEDKVINFSRASSGQQEVVWILYLLFQYLLKDSSIFPASPVFVVIEEPEAHLFPETQNQLVEFFGLFANAKPDNQLLITTHSPYILTALNNLIYAYQVGQKNPEAVNQLIPKQFWIDPRRVAAYFVENGTVRSIMDDELQHINAEEIDRASDLTNSLHEQLLEVELAGESDGM